MPKRSLETLALDWTPDLRPHSNYHSETQIATENLPAVVPSERAEIVQHLPGSEADRQEVHRTRNDLRRLNEQTKRSSADSPNQSDSDPECLASLIQRLNHRMRAPLNTIITSAAVLLSENLDAEGLNLMKVIRDSGEALLDILDEVLPGSASVSQLPLGEMGESASRILLVEDNPLNQKLALLMLEKLGYEVDVANGGREAIRMVAQGRYDLILMDILMPDMDGLDATRLIRATPGHCAELPIIAMTTSPVSYEGKAWCEAGMNDFLAKPVREPDLRGKLQRWLATPGPGVSG